MKINEKYQIKRLDERNMILVELKDKYNITRNEDGEEINRELAEEKQEKILGYYSNIESAVKALLNKELIQNIDKDKEELIELINKFRRELKEYVNKIENI